MEHDWRRLDQASLDREYDARATVPDYEAEAARYRDTSAAARAALRMVPDLLFDPPSGCALDLFPGAPGGPVFLWIHGGYWRALSKADNHCVAPGLVQGAGAHVAVMDYTLVPHADLDEIVRQVRAVLAFVVAHAAAWCAAGHEATVLPQEARNHFDLAVALGLPGDPLCRAAAAFMR